MHIMTNSSNNPKVLTSIKDKKLRVDVHDCNVTLVVMSLCHPYRLEV